MADNKGTISHTILEVAKSLADMRDTAHQNHLKKADAAFSKAVEEFAEACRPMSVVLMQGKETQQPELFTDADFSKVVAALEQLTKADKREISSLPEIADVVQESAQEAIEGLTTLEKRIHDFGNTLKG